jgi:hypothetical protein
MTTYCIDRNSQVLVTTQFRAVNGQQGNGFSGLAVARYSIRYIGGGNQLTILVNLVPDIHKDCMAGRISQDGIDYLVIDSRLNKGSIKVHEYISNINRHRFIQE